MKFRLETSSKSIPGDNINSLKREINNSLFTEANEILKKINIQFFSLILEDKDQYVGKCVGHIFGNWLCIEHFFIEKKYRKNRYGSTLLKKIEAHSKKNKIKFIHLETESFNGIDFYVKNGYEIFGQLNDYPITNQSKYYLKKKL